MKLICVYRETLQDYKKLLLNAAVEAIRRNRSSQTLRGHEAKPRFLHILRLTFICALTYLHVLPYSMHVTLFIYFYLESSQLYLYVPSTLKQWFSELLYAIGCMRSLQDTLFAS